MNNKLLSMSKIQIWLRQWVHEVSNIDDNTILYRDLDNKRKEFSVVVTQPFPNNVLFRALYGSSSPLDRHECSRRQWNMLVDGFLGGHITEKNGNVNIEHYFVAHGNDDNHDQLCVYDAYSAIQSTFNLLNDFFDGLEK